MFEETFTTHPFWPMYDVTTDGDSFVMFRSGVDVIDDTDRAHLILVLNWFDELRARF